MKLKLNENGKFETLEEKSDYKEAMHHGFKSVTQTKLEKTLESKFKNYAEWDKQLKITNELKSKALVREISDYFEVIIPKSEKTLVNNFLRGLDSAKTLGSSVYEGEIKFDIHDDGFVMISIVK